MPGTDAALREILNAMEVEQLAWIDLVRSLPAGQALDRPAGQWSAVDFLAHVASWKENAARLARFQAEPGAPAIDPDVPPSVALGIDVDRFNADFVSSCKDWTLDHALDYSERIHAELGAALMALPRERLFGGPWPHGARRWYWRPAVVHPAEHREEVEAGHGR